MENRISEYLDTLFDCGPQTTRAFELRDEMKQNLIEKYHDMVAEGKSPEDAYQAAINSLGNVGELFEDLKREEDAQRQAEGQPVWQAPQQSQPAWQQPQPKPQPQQEQQPEDPKERKRSALVRAIAVVLFILSPTGPVLMDLVGAPSAIGVLMFFMFIAAGVGLLIYNRAIKPENVKRVVDKLENWDKENREKEQERTSEELEHARPKNPVATAIKCAVWLVMIAVYFMVSFATMKWYITWVMFPIVSAVCALVDLITGGDDPKVVAGALQSLLWCFMISAYFMISFRTMAWHITWVIFLISAALSSFIGLIGDHRRSKVFGAIIGAMWCLLIAAYFIISFRTMAWHITWVVFLFGAAISVLLGALGKER